jgi:hypothetical protein
MYRQCLAAVLLSVSVQGLYAAPGASVPWTTYEAENMTISGGTSIGPPTQLANLGTTFIYAPQIEASGGEAVELTGPGQYVQFTAQAAANSLVLRYCVPDTISGTGSNSTISLYTNGIFAQEIPVTSEYSWRYGNYPFTNNPTAGSPRNFYDEARVNGLTINAGDTVRIEKGTSDLAAYDIVDLVDLEDVAAPITNAPANSLSILNYGAVGNGVTDCSSALQTCINLASPTNGIVWIPAGTYVISQTINLPSNASIQGAGMWYTTLIGNASLYNTTPSRRLTLNGNGSNIHLADFAMTGFLNYRNDSEANDGLGGSYGTGSTISRVWVEHTKTGAWIINSSGLVIDSCRFRNTIADGCNLAVGMRGTTVTNCTARGTGDDCFATWPATYTSQTYTPGFNTFTHCSAQVPNLANGGAIYGAVSNCIQDCAFSDIPYGCGILIAGTFAVGANTFAGQTVAQRCDLTRCGGYDPGWQWRGAVTLCPQYINITNVNLNHLYITNSLSYAVQIVSPGSSSTVGVLTNATMNLINVSGYGTQVAPFQQSPYVNGIYGVWARSDANGALNVDNLAVNGSPVMTMPAAGSTMANQSSGSPQDFAFNFLPTPTLSMQSTSGSLKLSWPANYIGWTLQAQTNSSGSGGINGNWTSISSSTTTNQIFIPVNNTNGSVFFRLSDQ